MQVSAVNDYDVYIAKCDDYDENTVESAMDEAIDAIDGLDFVKSGMKIVIKPNLVSFKRPDAAATTHPALLKALCKKILSLGASVVVGDSPGGPHSLAVLNRVYSATGMTELRSLGVELNKNMEQSLAHFESGKVLGDFQYTAYLDDADAIIDFCKLKSHGMLGMSAAVKNLFGVIPGLVKPEMHYQFPDERVFSDMLIDLNEYFKPRLTIVDAVVGMEGNGPTMGEPRHIGAVIASKSTYHADVVCAELIGMSIKGLPTLQAAFERGLAPESSLGLRLNCDLKDFIIDDFAAPPVRGLSFMQKGTFINRIGSTALAHKPKLHKKLCVGCAECARICPAHAIEMRNKLPRIDRDKCIRCFCCQEFCPKAAMQVHRPIIARVLNRIN